MSLSSAVVWVDFYVSVVRIGIHAQGFDSIMKFFQLLWSLFLIKIRYCHYCRCNVRSIVCCTSTCHFVYLQGLSVAMRGFRVYLSLGAKKFREYYTYANAVLALDCKN